MGPRRRQFWLPLTRLGAFFVAVVVAGNTVLYAFRPTVSEVPSSPDDSEDYYARKRRRIERQILRTMEMFLGPSVAPPKVKVGAAPPSSPIRSELSVIPAVESGPAPLPIAAPAPRTAPLPRPEGLSYLEPAPLPFTWPEPLPSPGLEPSAELSGTLALSEAKTFRMELVQEFYRRGAANPAADVGDAILRGPELLLDEVFTFANGMSPRPETRSWDDDTQGSMMSRILAVQVGPRNERIGSEFMNQFMDREMKYVANFGESRADTFQFQEGTQPADYRELMMDQRKVFWDALRRTYLSRYKVQADERVRDEAWYVDRWSGADFVVLPPLLGAYVFYRGLEKKFTIGSSRLLLSIEPVSQWYRSTKHDLPAAAAFEWTMKGCPLGVIVSAGLHEGHYGLDFVGIGTSLGAARRALVMQEMERW